MRGARTTPVPWSLQSRPEAGKSRVYVLPITHTKPTASENGIEILPRQQASTIVSLFYLPHNLINPSPKCAPYPRQMGPDTGLPNCSLTANP